MASNKRGMSGMAGGAKRNPVSTGKLPGGGAKGGGRGFSTFEGGIKTTGEAVPKVRNRMPKAK